MVFSRKNSFAGFTIVEVIFVAALSTLIFAGLLASFQYTIDLTNNSKAKLSALSVANDQMEYFRSLPYSEVGTIFGIPPGTIPQNSTTTLNGIQFNKRVLVEYVDDPADGEGAADSNGILADYKRVKLTVSWTYRSVSSEISLISNIVPRSIETSAGGGTIRVNVIDADASFLPGAQVPLFNNTTPSTINVTRTTDSNGIALFSGAPAASNYQVFVTAPGYSQDQTYVATTSNPNPITAPFSVLEADVSTVTFQIGELSDIELTTYSSITDDVFYEGFASPAGVATSTNTAVSGGVLRLSDVAGVYSLNGSAYLTAFTPASIEQWEAISVAAITPGASSYRIRLFTASSSAYTLVPESDLPGNSAGFVGPIISIKNLDAATYPSLVLGVSLETNDSTQTPSLDEVAVYYRSAETRRANTSLTVHGMKTIGTDLSAAPIYKYSGTIVTDGTGEEVLPDMEFDTYSIQSPSLTVARACPAIPLAHQAGIVSEVDMVLVSAGAHTLRTSIVDATGVAIPGATVTLTRPSFLQTSQTDACGQSFFSSAITSNSDYEINVSKPGFVTQIVSSVAVSGETSTLIILNEL